MRPILFEIFGWGVPSWHFFFVLAALSAYALAHIAGRLVQQRAADGAQAERFLVSLNTLFVICYLSGWFGARALSIVVEQFEVTTAAQFVIELFSIGPMTFYGGACAAVVLGSVYIHRQGVDLKLALDCGILGGVFALGMGRIGCFLNGDDYGMPVLNQSEPPWWAVRFDVLRDGGLYRYPVQLEETVASWLIAGLGFFLLRHYYPQGNKGRGGRTAAWIALLSAAHRIFNESFRGDPRGTFFATQISTSSGISLLIIGFCAYCLVRMRITERRPVL
ncbi:MAG: prolipoprotein diacylglyceryl transferase Lgt2 [Pseudomonadota bacterium]|jgi:phosphatidylglycerol:prolipoprotein diacylglycerol transferase